MQHYYKRLGKALRDLERRRAQKFDQAVLGLEQIYLKVYQNAHASWQESFAASRQFILAHMLTFEFYFIFFALLFVAFASGLFFAPGHGDQVLTALNIFLIGLMSGLIPLAIAALVFPLHVKFRVGLGLLVALTVLSAALVFSSVFPIIEARVFGVDMAGFDALFGKVIMIYSISVTYLQIRIHRLVSFGCFRKRHQEEHLLGLVPADKQGQLLSFSAQDHYVEIVTTKGRHLHRLSMKQALDMVNSDQGMQVHRSHWVAFEALLSLHVQSGRNFALLRNGTRVPVSKAKAEEVETYLESLKMRTEFA